MTKTSEGTALDMLMGDAPKGAIVFIPMGKTTIKLLYAPGRTEFKGCWEKYESFYQGKTNGLKYTVPCVVISSTEPGVADKNIVRYVSLNRQQLLDINSHIDNGWDDLLTEKGSCLVITKYKKSNGFWDYKVEPIKTQFDSKGVVWQAEDHATATTNFAQKMKEKQLGVTAAPVSEDLF